MKRRLERNEISMRILIVDDGFVNRMKMAKVLETFGVCVTVESGQAALNAIEMAIDNGAPFDLLTLDVSMPLMDGAETLSKARKIEEQRNIPKEKRIKVIMVTSMSDKETVTKCIQAGCDSYVVKPFDRAIMTRRLAELGIKPQILVQPR